MDPQIMAMLAKMFQPQPAQQMSGMGAQPMSGGIQPMGHHHGNPPPTPKPPPAVTTQAPPQNPFSMPGVRLFGPSPTITPMFRHLFGQQQVGDFGIRQPMQTISPTIGNKGQLDWNVGTNAKWWEQGSPTTWRTLPPPKADKKNGGD